MDSKGRLNNFFHRGQRRFEGRGRLLCDVLLALLGFENRLRFYDRDGETRN